MTDQAIILAAGRGVRMQPLTFETPKPLLAFHERPMMDYMIEHLAAAGFAKIVVNGWHLADQISEFIAKKQAEYPGIEFIFMREYEELDIARGVLNALPHFGDRPFFVLNGDIFWTGDAGIFARMDADFEKNHRPALALCPSENQISAVKRGEYRMNPDGTISSGGEPLDMAYMGIHITRADFLNDIPPAGDTRFLSLSRKWKILENSGNLRGVVFNGKLYHLSIPADLKMPLQ